MDLFLGTLAFVITTVSSAVPVVAVQSPIDKDAAFESPEDKTGKPGGTLVASPKDGARIVVGEAALLTATHGSKILKIDALDNGGVRLVLQNGGYLVHVGSKGAILEIGEFEVQASSARLAVVQKHGAWLVQVKELYTSLKPVVRYKSLNPDTPMEAAVDPYEPKVLELDSAKTFRFAPGKEPNMDFKEGEGFIRTLEEDLKEPIKTVILEPLDVEDPADLVAAGSSSEGDMTEIEIEAVEIEIEADCIEVCMD